MVSGTAATAVTTAATAAADASTRPTASTATCRQTAFRSRHGSSSVAAHSSGGSTTKLTTSGATRTAGTPPDGISIPSLTHGQMAVISDNLSSIRALASGRIGFEMTTWRLEDYLNSSVLRLSVGCFSGQHRGRGESVQRMRPCLSRRRAGAPLAIAPGAGRRPQSGRCAYQQDRGRDAGQWRVAHAVPLQRRTVQHQRGYPSPMERNSVAPADRGIRRACACRDRRRGMGRMAKAERDTAAGREDRVGLPSRHRTRSLYPTLRKGRWR